MSAEIGIRLRVTIGYDGSDFRGWQRQRSQRSVQGVLEDVLGNLTGSETHVVGSGRTDAGVHAAAQVAHFDTKWFQPPEELGRALNAELPRDIVVLELALVSPDFHARHSALWRTYRYTILAQPLRDPLVRRTSFHVRSPLDVAAMAQSARELVGQHDFAAFGRAMSPGGPTVRRVYDAKVCQVGNLVRIEVKANAFLRHQVRRTVGHLVDVGLGRAVFGDTIALLEGDRDVKRLPWRCPPQGLVLVAVGYPGEVNSMSEACTARPDGGE